MLFSGMTVTENVSFILVFLEGLLSFFSPCVLPLIPVYVSYLAGNGREFQRKKVLLNTLFFIAGISNTFFILGLSFSSLGMFFSKNKLLFTKVGGIIIIILGLSQLEILKLNFLKKQKKINLEFNQNKMNPVLAYIMGFTFSFAWTPCVGPALSSVLILASNASSTLKGNILVLVYTLGFIIPFLILGLFTTQTLNFFKRNKKFMKYTTKIGGILLIIIGILTFTGMFTTLSRYLAY